MVAWKSARKADQEKEGGKVHPRGLQGGFWPSQCAAVETWSNRLSKILKEFLIPFSFLNFLPLLASRPHPFSVYPWGTDKKASRKRPPVQIADTDSRGNKA